MEELNDIETLLLNGLVEKFPLFETHIPYLKVTERKITGVGMYVNFDYLNFNGQFENINTSFSNQENIKIDSLEHGLCYEIDITDGKIKFIELITYGENWDGEFGNYKIVQ